MKLLNETGQIDDVKIFNCKDCNAWVIDVDGKHLDSLEVLANNYRIVNLSIQEMKDLNEFIEPTREMIRVCWDYFQGRLDEAAAQEAEKGEGNGDNRPEEN